MPETITTRFDLGKLLNQLVIIATTLCIVLSMTALVLSLFSSYLFLILCPISVFTVAYIITIHIFQILHWRKFPRAVDRTGKCPPWYTKWSVMTQCLLTLVWVVIAGIFGYSEEGRRTFGVCIGNTLIMIGFLVVLIYGRREALRSTPPIENVADVPPEKMKEVA